MDGALRRRRAGEVAVVLFASSLAGAVRALGAVATVVMYAFALSGIVLIAWLFLLTG